MMKTRPRSPQLSLRLRAVGLLARREHSRAELARKLAPLGASEEISAVLDRLEQTGLLSDARAANAYVRSHAVRFGVAKLEHSLRSKGIGDELIAASLAQEGMTDELQRARELWRRKFAKRQSAMARDAKEWARQARFLQSRGFSVEIIRKLLKQPDDE